jgi:hypothetical protein
MEQQMPLSQPAAAQQAFALGLNEQACNECKRRKGRCDRVLPECGPCARNKRHCLYVGSVKTPLTRKYLTSVEERLRQAEHKARHLERRAQVAEARLAQHDLTDTTARQSPNLGAIDDCPGTHADAAQPTVSPSTAKRLQQEFAASAQVIDHGGHKRFVDDVNSEWQYVEGLRNQVPMLFTDAAESSGVVFGPQNHDLEAPPSEADDFSVRKLCDI